MWPRPKIDLQQLAQGTENPRQTERACESNTQFRPPKPQAQEQREISVDLFLSFYKPQRFSTCSLSLSLFLSLSLSNESQMSLELEK